jgi:hypothetical protein
MKPVAAATLAFAALALTCSADTLYLKSGVQIHGTIVKEVDGVITMRVGDRETAYRAKSVVRREKNSRTGVENREQLAERLARREAELQEKTGLTREQRDKVKKLMWDLQSPVETTSRAAEDELVALGAEWDLVRYFDYYLPSLRPRFVPGVIRVLARIDRKRALPIALRHVDDADPLSRETAIMACAGLGGIKTVATVARGAVDPHDGVRAASCHALAFMGARSATPLLLANLTHADPRVQNASGEALSRLWSTDTRRIAFDSVAEWAQFWEEEKDAHSSAFTPENVEPLVAEGARFEDE